MFKSKKAVKKSKKWQRGLSLIEAAMVLALSAVVVAGVMAYYQSASTNEKTERTISEIMSVLSAINSTYSSAPNFNGITSTIIAKTGALPASFIGKDDKGKVIIKTPNGYPIEISAGSLDNKTNNDEYFNIQFDVPATMCGTMSRLDLGSSLVQMAIGDATKPLPSLPLSVADSQKYCDLATEGGEDKNKNPLPAKDHVTIAYAFH
ncbi:pilus assembly protein [Serratia sp. UGAL515B_01]|uniref:pilus assembly protein n=1 Tax=Serratia sp. UGAL515B_01 TaxID=2986763 RepID=UPI002952D0BA|nr:pilus assembly protein [Serratia sp. UGAL515B_01]WON76966.1 pilus assembly protein [Serratia sp. UGAL515B_01]